MPVRIALLRGINLGPANRVPMAELRELFAESGYEDVRTYVQSGNVIFSSGKTPAALAGDIEQLVADRFGLDLRVVVRTREEILKVVQLNPLGEVADNPKRYQVSFLDRKPPAKVVEMLEELVVEPEALHVDGREIYAWHPEGVARSKLWNTLAGKKLGVNATARNWTTVTTLLELADELAES